jgi:hypothetical protein
MMDAWTDVVMQGGMMVCKSDADGQAWCQVNSKLKVNSAIAVKDSNGAYWVPQGNVAQMKAKTAAAKPATRQGLKYQGKIYLQLLPGESVDPSFKQYLIKRGNQTFAPIDMEIKGRTAPAPAAAAGTKAKAAKTAGVASADAGGPDCADGYCACENLGGLNKALCNLGAKMNAWESGAEANIARDHSFRPIDDLKSQLNRIANVLDTRRGEGVGAAGAAAAASKGPNMGGFTQALLNWPQAFHFGRK